MAKLSSDGKYVTVESGDTLSEIAEKYAGGVSKVSQLQAINKIQNKNLIYVGQKIYLTGSSSGSTSGSTTNTSSNSVRIEHFGLQSGTDRTVFASWSWNKSDTDHYQARWYYATGDGVGFLGTDDNVTLKHSVYTAPQNAYKVQVYVKPISKKKTVKKSDGSTYETNYWTADWSEPKDYFFSDNPPTTPPTPTIKQDGCKLTASVDNLDVYATSVEFQLAKNDSSFIERTVDVKARSASYTFTLGIGNTYKVRCRAISGNKKSEWSEYTTKYDTPPSAPSQITSIKAVSSTEVQLEWSAVKNATTYKVEYTTETRYFDTSSNVTSVSIDAKVANSATIPNLTSGDEYFFRVRAENNNGESAWTSIKSIIVGKTPTAPTTWSSVTTAIVGEDVTLYWVHNSRDGSSQTRAKLRVYINDVLQSIPVIENSTDEDEKDKTSFYVLPTSNMGEGAVIRWSVQTMGVLPEYGEWSVERTIDVYSKPDVDLEITNSDGDSLQTITNFPFYIKTLGDSASHIQIPIGYHINIVSNEIYETIDNVGNQKIVNIGESIYSRFFDTSEMLIFELSAGNIDLQNGISYTLSCTVSMNSGLTGQASKEFTVRWTDELYSPNAEIGIDENNYSAIIRPYCTNDTITYYKVDNSSGEYIKTSNAINSVWSERTEDVTTTTGEQVYFGTTDEGEEVYYCEVRDSNLVEDVSLSVYRREFDGTFTEIATGIKNSDSTFVSDPHPSLDYARYRIVATVESTGAISYYDIPSYPVGGKAIIIQWDEEWSTFETYEEADPLANPPWVGSLLKLPYNINVSDRNDLDVALVEYVGRKRPVSYYGTQLGETSTWTTDIPKSDTETLYALRRLRNWPGDVYVREPSGSGYWANIKVTFSQNHREMKIPVTLELTRVEGGM